MPSKEFIKNWRIGFRVILYAISLYVIFLFIAIGISFMIGDSSSKNAALYPILGFLIFFASSFLFIYSIGFAIRNIYKRLKENHK